MRIELKLIETIERYLMGTLSKEERTDFENRMNADSNLKQQVDLQSQIMEGIQRMALKSSTQNAYKSFKLQSFLIKLVVIAVIVTAATVGLMQLLKSEQAEQELVKYEEKQDVVIFPENDSLSAEANQYLEQEIFHISTNHDTVIETKDGIVIYIPENAFNTSEEQVDLLVQGATTAEDILWAGLSTVTTDGNELETGGMFYIDAFVNGQRVDLLKQLTASVPTAEVKPGMDLYEGVKDSVGEIVWTNPKPLEHFLTPVEITKLDFYPPGYEAAMNEMGYEVRDFLDSVYYSFACDQELVHSTSMNVEKSLCPVRYLNERGRSELKDRIREADSMWADQTNSRNLTSTEEVVLIGTKTKPLGNGIYELEVTATPKDGWVIGQMANKDSNPIISNTEIYFSEGKVNFIGGPYQSIFGSSVSISGRNNYTNQYRFTYYVSVKRSTTLEATMVYMACREDVCFPPEIRGLSFNISGDSGLDSYCPGINPASIKTIWNKKFNGTNLATREFEERMPWIHKSCENKVLDLYINNLDKTLSQVDSMVLKYVNGEVKQKFQEFAARGDGRVELESQAAEKLAAYYEKKREAHAKALAETNRNYWEEQNKKDLESSTKENESVVRSNENSVDVFRQEYHKNLCKVYDELALNKDCNAPAQPVPPAAYTVPVNRLGWMNIDRLVSEATANRQTTTFKQNGRTSTLTYLPWTAQIEKWEVFDRINVYNIPVEFNSYVKINGSKGKYTYNLNQDLTYQTVITAWTEKAIYFFKEDSKSGEISVSLKPVSDQEWRNEIRASIGSVNGMSAEMDFTEHMQKDQKRVNVNKEKRNLRAKIEPVIFPCGQGVYEMVDSTVVAPF